MEDQSDVKLNKKITEKQKQEFQRELQRQFNMFKKRFKVLSKSELVATIWEQGLEFRKLQDITQELYAENKALKESTDVKSDKETK
jgi:flagellar biosynthesis regulator FlbT